MAAHLASEAALRLVKPGNEVQLHSLNRSYLTLVESWQMLKFGILRIELVINEMGMSQSFNLYITVFLKSARPKDLTG
jgi:hypothetical protein